MAVLAFKHMFCGYFSWEWELLEAGVVRGF